MVEPENTRHKTGSRADMGAKDTVGPCEIDIERVE